MKKIKVCHDTGTSDLNVPDGGGRITYWEKKKSLCVPQKCPCCDKPKNKSDFVGAHVYKYIDTAMGCNRPKYITPTCKSCNDKYKNSFADKHPFDVDERMLLPV